MGCTFVSYSRQQLYFAEGVSQILKRAGVDVWFDIERLSPGILWPDALQEGTRQCERLVLIASSAAFESQYVKVEWETALARGCDVIVVVAETVDLPDPLKACAVYDARVAYDETIAELARDIRLQRYSLHPKGSSGLRRGLIPCPRDIVLTAALLSVPSILTLGLGTTFALNLPLESMGDSSRHIGRAFLPEGLVMRGVMLIMTVLLAWRLLSRPFPVLQLLDHDIRTEQLHRAGIKLIALWAVVGLLSLVSAVRNNPFDSVPSRIAAIGSGLMLTLGVIWYLRVLRRSPQLLRWLPSGNAGEDLLATVNASPARRTGRASPKPLPAASMAAMTYSIHHHDADRHIGDVVGKVLTRTGLRAVGEDEAKVQIILVSNRTSISWLQKQSQELSGRVVHVFATNLNTPTELAPLLKRQWVDYRNGRAATIEALAWELGDVDSTDDSLAAQAAPTGFDNGYGFPRSVRLFLGGLVVLYAGALIALLPERSNQDEWDWLGYALVAPVAYAAHGLIMRKRSLPPWLYRIAGDRLAWFAAPAAVAADPIGNSDNKFLYDKDFLMLVEAPHG